MFKILIVDDEKTHRIGLMKLLYTLYPEDMFLEAASGEQALETLELLECDIVITDIRMPGINGLELLHQIRKNHNDIAVIFLSGYEEFSYAKEALKYGTKEYLLKPVEVSEVKKCLDQVRSEITFQREKNANHESMKNHLKETEIIYAEYLMQQFVRNTAFEKKERILEVFPIEQPGYFFLCDIKIQDGGSLNIPEFRMAMKSCIAVSSYSFLGERENLYTILVLDQSKGDRSFFDHIRSVLHKRFPGCSFAFYVSGWHKNMYEEGPDAYQEAVKIWKYRFYELGDFCDWDLLREKLDGDLENFLVLSGKTAGHIKQNDILSAFQPIKEAVSNSSEKKLPSPERLLRSVMLLLFQVVKELDPLLSNELKSTVDETLNHLYQSETLSKLLRSVYSFLLSLGKDANFQKQVKGIHVMEHCCKYLQKHYMEEITLETVAEKYYFNPSYFSTLFKNYSGSSFSNYLTALRMQKAKEFLAFTDDKVKEIAVKTGYRDPNYFIRAFKKFYGYTPDEYRRLKAKDDKL